MFKKLTAAVALALLASSSFAAAPTALYGGLDVGSTKVDDLGDKTSAGAFLGYGFNRYFAIELGYRQLGKWDLGGDADLTINQTHLTVVASYPLNGRLDIYGRAGRNYLRDDVKYAGGSDSLDGDGALYGIGLNYSFAPNLSGRVEAQKPSTDSINYGVGIVYKF
jgi:OOP family OmpA-OmpF porin